MSAVRRAMRRAARPLPEATLQTLVQFLHGELPFQERIRRAGVSLFAGSSDGPAYASKLLNTRGLRARVVEKSDLAAVRGETVGSLGAALDADNVAYVAVPQAGAFGPSIAVSQEDRGRTLTALANSLTGPEWAVEPLNRKPSTLRSLRWAVPASKVDPADFANAAGVRVFRALAAPNGEMVASAESACELQFWKHVKREGIPRPDGGTFPIGTRIAPEPAEGIVAYLSPESWQAATEAPDHWIPGKSTRTLFQVREPIDFVYTWVDGHDPAWLARKAAFLSDDVAAEVNDTAVHGSRFVSRNELKYSLRSVAMYASWVRKIFIVTDGQVPAWLDTSHPKIEVVDHRQIFTDSSALPVFNSHAIESQLHHIPDLSEHYLYLNDDVFFGRPVQPELFFHGNGTAKFFLSRAVLDIDPPSSLDLPVMSAAKRNRELIEARFGATIIHKFKHTPHPQLRSVLEELEKTYPDVFMAVSRSRFRHPDDLSIAAALHHYYAYGSGRAMPSGIRYFYQDIARKDTPRRLGNLARTRDYDVFCLNDHETPPDQLEAQQQLLGEFFERYFPVPSPFERR